MAFGRLKPREAIAIVGAAARLPGASKLVGMSSDDGRVVAVVTAGDEARAHLIDARSGRVVRTLPANAITDGEKHCKKDSKNGC